MNFFNRSKSTNYQTLDAATYHSDYVDGKQPHMLVDVRTAGEYARGHVPGAVNIPLSEIAGRTAELPDDQPVVVVCASGNRSKSGCAQLTKAGFKNIYNFNGGTSAWKSAGFSLE